MSILNKRKKKIFLTSYIDKTYLFSIFSILIISIIFVYSSSIYDSINKNLELPYISLIKQIIFILIGLIAYLISMKIPIKKYFKYNKSIIIGTLLLCLSTFLFKSRNGSHRWIELGMFTIQPSEIGKLCIILLWAKYITIYNKKIFNLFNKRKKGKFIKIFFNYFNFPIIVTFFFVILFKIQSDNGSWILSLFVVIILLFSSGVFPKRYNFYFIIMLISLIFSILFLYFYISSLDKETLISLGTKGDKYNYILGRFVAWVNPFLTYNDSGYQIVNSLLAISSGGFFGKGIGNGIQKQGFLTEGYNDFIIANIAEEAGLIGLILVYLIYLIIIFKGFKISIKSKNYFSYLVGIGIITLFFIQIFWNGAGVVGLLPMKGLTAPLLSYGGTSLIISLFSLGIIQRINIETKIFKSK